jgi:uncharacterized membrane protein
MVEKLSRGRLLHLIAILLFVAVGILLIVVYQRIPAQVPTRFSFSGEIVGYGSKVNLIILYFIGVSVWLMMGGFKLIMQKFPQTINVPFEITEHNRRRVYAIVFHMTDGISFISVLLFIGINIQLLLVGLGLISNLGWYLLLFIPVLIGYSIFSIVRLMRAA